MDGFLVAFMSVGRRRSVGVVVVVVVVVVVGGAAVGIVAVDVSVKSVALFGSVSVGSMIRIRT